MVSIDSLSLGATPAEDDRGTSSSTTDRVKVSVCPFLHHSCLLSNMVAMSHGSHGASEMLLVQIEMCCEYNTDVIFCCYCCLVAQWYLTLCNPRDCSLRGFSAHGIVQVRLLEWVALPFSRGSSQPRDQIWVFRITGRFFTI